MRRNVSRLMAYMLAVLITFMSVTDYCQAAPATGGIFADDYLEALVADSEDVVSETEAGSISLEAEMIDSVNEDLEAEENMSDELTIAEEDIDVDASLVSVDDSEDDVLVDSEEDSEDDAVAEEDKVTDLSDEEANLQDSFSVEEDMMNASAEDVADNSVSADYIASGHINNGTEDGIDWSVDTDGLLLITGTGDFKEVSEGGETWLQAMSMPWYDCANNITAVKISVTQITSFYEVLWCLYNVKTLDMSESDFSDVTNIYWWDLGALETIRTPKNVMSDTYIWGMDSNSEKKYYTSDGWMVCGFPTSEESILITTEKPGVSPDETDVKSGTITCTEFVDGMESKSHKVSWSINGAGEFVLDGEYFSVNGANPWAIYGKNVKNVILNISRAGSLDSLFSGFENMTELEVPEGTITGITSMNNMFSRCSSMKKIDMTLFDTSDVTNMGSMFSECRALESIDFTNIDTSNVTCMYGMFQNCSSLQEVDVSGFDISNVNEIAWMFFNCSSLKELDLSSWNVTNLMVSEYVFNGCDNLSEIDVPVNLNTTISLPSGQAWYNEAGMIISTLPKNLTKSQTISTTKPEGVTTIGGVIENDLGGITWSISGNYLSVVGAGEIKNDYFGYMPWHEFREDITFATIELSDVENLSNLFYGCENLRTVDLSKLDTSKTTTMSSMFSGCSSLENVDLSKFNTLQTTDMNNMFYECRNLQSVDVSGFNTKNVTNMGNMFQYCTSLTDIDVTKFDVSSVNVLLSMFYDCKSLTSLDLSTFTFNADAQCGEMLYGCENLAEVKGPANLSIAITLPSNNAWYNADGLIINTLPKNATSSQIVSTTKPEGVTTIGGIIDNDLGGVTWSISDNCLIVSGKGEIRNGDALPWYAFREEVTSAMINLSEVKDLSYLFSGFTNLETVYLTGLDTSEATTMAYMFNNCSSLQSIDVTGFNTSCVTTMENMFCSCSSLQSIDVSAFDTSLVWDMGNMFSGCLYLQNIDVTKFDVASVKYVWNMFWECQALESLDLSSFALDEDVQCGSMLSGCNSLSIVQAPAKLKANIDLPSINPWYSSEGMIITSLPKNATTSQMITTIRPEGLEKIGGFIENDKGGVTWSISEGYLSVEGKGELKNGSSYMPWYALSDEITSAMIDLSEVNDLSCLFYGCRNLVEVDLSALDTSETVNMSQMFCGCSKLLELDVTDFVTTNVTNIDGVFQDCASLTELDLSSWDVSKVTNAQNPFWGCESLEILDISSLSFGADVWITNFFYQCNNLNTISTPENLQVSIDLPTYSPWYRSDGMIVSVLPKNTKSQLISTTKPEGVTTIGGVIENDKGGVTWTISDNHLSVKGKGEVNSTGGQMPWYQFKEEITSATIDLADAENLSNLFSGCYNLKEVDLSKLDTSVTTNMGYMFYNCSNLSELDLSGFDTSNVINMREMFEYCRGLSELDLSKFDLKNVDDAYDMFYGCNLDLLKTPINVGMDINLYNSLRGNGTVYNSLPMNSSESITLISDIDDYVLELDRDTIYAIGDMMPLEFSLTKTNQYDGNKKEITSVKDEFRTAELYVDGVKIKDTVVLNFGAKSFTDAEGLNAYEKELKDNFDAGYFWIRNAGSKKTKNGYFTTYAVTFYDTGIEEGTHTIKVRFLYAGDVIGEAEEVVTFVKDEPKAKQVVVSDVNNDINIGVNAYVSAGFNDFGENGIASIVVKDKSGKVIDCLDVSHKSDVSSEDGRDGVHLFYGFNYLYENKSDYGYYYGKAKKQIFNFTDMMNVFNLNIHSNVKQKLAVGTYDVEIQLEDESVITLEDVIKVTDKPQVAAVMAFGRIYEGGDDGGEDEYQELYWEYSEEDPYADFSDIEKLRNADTFVSGFCLDDENYFYIKVLGTHLTEDMIPYVEKSGEMVQTDVEEVSIVYADKYITRVKGVDVDTCIVYKIKRNEPVTSWVNISLTDKDGNSISGNVSECWLTSVESGKVNDFYYSAEDNRIVIQLGASNFEDGEQVDVSIYDDWYGDYAYGTGVVKDGKVIITPMNDEVEVNLSEIVAEIVKRRNGNNSESILSGVYSQEIFIEIGSWRNWKNIDIPYRIVNVAPEKNENTKLYTYPSLEQAFTYSTGLSDNNYRYPYVYSDEDKLDVIYHFLSEESDYSAKLYLSQNRHEYVTSSGNTYSYEKVDTLITTADLIAGPGISANRYDYSGSLDTKEKLVAGNQYRIAIYNGDNKVNDIRNIKVIDRDKYYISATNVNQAGDSVFISFKAFDDEKHTFQLEAYANAKLAVQSDDISYQGSFKNVNSLLVTMDGIDKLTNYYLLLKVDGEYAYDIASLEQWKYKARRSSSSGYSPARVSVGSSGLDSIVDGIYVRNSAFPVTVNFYEENSIKAVKTLTITRDYALENGAVVSDANSNDTEYKYYFTSDDLKDLNNEGKKYQVTVIAPNGLSDKAVGKLTKFTQMVDLIDMGADVKGQTYIIATKGKELPNIESLPTRKGYEFKGYYLIRYTDGEAKKVFVYDETGKALIDNPFNCVSDSAEDCLYAEWYKDGEDPTPTEAPTAKPTEAPTATPTAKPTATPTVAPTATPTVVPTEEPTATPEPTAVPTEEPTATPAPTVAPHVHTLVKHEAIDATIYAGGNKEYYECSGCKKFFSTKDATQEIAKDSWNTAQLPMPEEKGAELAVKEIEEQTYTGAAIKPAPIVKNSLTGEVLTEGVDYTVSYADNKNEGTATVTIKGKGNYTGSVTTTFVIKKLDITAMEELQSKEEDAISVEKAKVIFGAITFGMPEKDIESKITVKSGSEVITLVKDVDYKIAFSGLGIAGKGKAYIVGIGKYCGVLEKAVTVKPASVDSFVVTAQTAEYDPMGATTDVIVKTADGTILKENVDYKLKYKNNKKPGIATVTITGINNYKGSISATFEITGTSFDKLGVFAYATDVKVGSKTKVTVMTADGKKLAANKDYELAGDIDKIEEPGKHTVTIKGLGNYGGSSDMTINFYAYTAIKKGMSDVTEENEVAKLGKAKLQTPVKDHYYTGISVYLDPKEELLITDGSNNPLELGKDYEIVGYYNNVDKGTAKVIVKGMGKCSGIKIVSFKISSGNL